MIGLIRATFRLLAFVLIVSFHIIRILVFNILKGKDLERNLQIRQDCLAQFSNALGLVIKEKGTFPKGGGLLVCNHRSYIDPVLIMCSYPAMPVAKIQVSHWPIIGFGLKVSGTLFVDRSSDEGRAQTRKAISEKLRDGYFIINYAEGTTHSNPSTIEFKMAMFKEAAKEGFAIYPVALEYKDPEAAFLGDDKFLPHFLRYFKRKKIEAQISYGPKLYEKDSQILLQKTKIWIDRELMILQQRFIRDEE